MSTQAVAPELPKQDVITEQVTYVKVKEPDTQVEQKDGTVKNVEGAVKVYPESEELDKQITDGEYEELFRQSYIFPKAQTKAGCELLVTDEEEFTNIFVRGLTTKLQNKARTRMLAKDSAPVEGTVDLTQFANEKSERRSLSPLEKTLKDISGLDAGSKTQLMAILAQLQAEQAAALNA